MSFISFYTRRISKSLGTPSVSVAADIAAMRGGTDTLATLSDQLDGVSIAAGAIQGVTASDTLLKSHDAETNLATSGYTIVKRILVLCGGILRVKFDIKTASGTAYGRIYKNGTAYGTEQTSTSATYETKSEDLQVAIGDYLGVYIYSSISAEVYIQNFRLYGTLETNFAILL